MQPLVSLTGRQQSVLKSGQETLHGLGSASGNLGGAKSEDLGTRREGYPSKHETVPARFLLFCREIPRVFTPEKAPIRYEIPKGASRGERVGDHTKKRRLSITNNKRRS